jgi:rRNA biogenesis protein RRP5
LIKKWGSKTLDVWMNYAHFLHATLNEPDRARALLTRARQALGDEHLLPLTVRFAALEFRSPNGDAERGRTLFENLISAQPKKLDLWDRLADLEMASYATAKARARAQANGNGAEASHGKGGEHGEAGADPTPVRAVFERAARMPRLKARWARAWFKKWAKWEEDNGDEKSRAVVSVRAREWVAAEEARKTERREAGEDEE